MNFKLKLSMAVTFCLLSMMGYSQSTKISGVVVSADEKPLAGVTVLITGSAAGATTDAQGRFSLTVPRGGTTLTVSYIGYRTEIVPIGSKTDFQIVLQEQIAEIEEIVAIGYGHARRSDLTGSVASISSMEIEGKIATSVDDLIRGRVTGVKVSSQDGAPGAANSIKIRGGTSINASSEPLYVIDGFPVMISPGSYTVGTIGGVGSLTNPLADLNPEDIRSIDILKDASATAIYGSRGANGVIIITTKQARDEKNSVSYTGYHSVSMKPDYFPVMNSEEFRTAMNEKRRYMLGTNGTPSGNYIFSQSNWDTYQTNLENLRNTDWSEIPNTNWQKEIFRLGNVSKHQLTFSGGNPRTKYISVADFHNIQGIVKHTDYTRISGRVNVDHNINAWLAFRTNNSYVWSEHNGATQASGSATGSASGIFLRALRYYPDVALETEIIDDNSVISDESDDLPVSNPYTLLRHAIRARRGQTFTSNNAFTATITPELVFRSSINARITNIKQDQFYSKLTGMGAATNGRARIGYIYGQDLLNENILTYANTFCKVHKLNLMSGFTTQRYIREDFVANAQSFPNEDLRLYDISVGTVFAPPTSYVSEWSLMSFLMRANYGYNDKYLLTASIRADGSSRFAPGHKWGYFPSAAVAWRISQEKFLLNNKTLSNLKVRVGYGMTGNQEIPLYRSQRTYRTVNVAFNDDVLRGYQINTMSNKRLTWETTEQTNVGLDIELFKGRLTITTDGYYKLTKDLLLTVPTMPSSGMSSTFMNIGKVDNMGLEVALFGEILKARPRSKKLGWTMDFNFTRNRNRVLSLGSTNEFLRTLSYADGAGRDQIIVRVGESLGSWYGYVTDGIVQYKDDYLNRISMAFGNTPTVGDYKFVDQNGDGVINEADRVILGSSPPLYYGGFSTALRYGNFDLSMTFEYSYGSKLFNATNVLSADLSSTFNLPAYLRDRWVGPDWMVENGKVALDSDGLPSPIPGTGNPSNKIPRAGYQMTYQLQDNYLEDGSYLRLSNVKLRYSFPTQFCRRFGLGYCAVYVAANNLWLLTKYTGSDPDVNIDPNGYGNVIGGYDFDAYPRSKIFTLGLTLNF